jgi:hypothetical protein
MSIVTKEAGHSHSQAPGAHEKANEEEGSRRRRRETLLNAATCALVLAVQATVQVAFLLGPYPYDPAKYFWTAVDFSSTADIWALRIGLVLPVRVAVLLLGPSEAALYAVPLAVGLALAAAVYGSMLLLFGDRLVAAAGALVATLHTNWLLKSSSIFPDTAATAVFTAGFFCLLAGAKRSAAGDRTAASVLALAAGALFGWTYLIREFSPILFPVALVAMVLLGHGLRRVVLVASAALLTAGLELLYGQVRFGNPFIHLRVLRNFDEGLHLLSPRHARSTEEIQARFNTLLDTMSLFPRLLLTWRAGWFFVLLMVVFVVGLALRYRDRRLWILASWVFSFWIVMATLGLPSLPSGRWLVNITIIRYWYPIFPPLVMGAFGALVLLLPKRIPTVIGIAPVHLAAVLLAAFVIVPGLVEFERCKAKDVWVNDPPQRWHELRAWFATPEADLYALIWTDYRTQRLLPGFTSSTFGHPLWKGAVRRLPKVDGHLVPPPPRQRSLLLINSDRSGSSRAVTRLRQVREQWSPIFITEDRAMLVLGPATGPSSEDDWWNLVPQSRNTAKPGTCGRPSL